jgi:hypothetical protein
MDRATSPVYGGTYSLEFKNTTPASDPYILSDYIPIKTNSAYYARASIYSSSDLAANKCAFAVYLYDSSKGYLSSEIIRDAAMTDPNIWFEHANYFNSGSAAYARLYCGKTKNAFTAYFGSAEIQESPHKFCAYTSSDQSITAGADETIEFNSEYYDWGSRFIAASNYLLSRRTAVWHFDAACYVSGIAADKGCYILFQKNGSGTERLGLAHSTPVNADLLYHVSADIPLDEEDYVSVVFHNGDTADRTVEAGGWMTYFSGHEIW